MTSSLIPLCHNVELKGVEIDVEICDPVTGGDAALPEESDGDSQNGGIVRDEGSLRIAATAKTFGQTGVEMEALVAASMASLSAYDMCKGVDRGMWIGEVRVVEKRGGRSGDWVEGVRVNEGEDVNGGGDGDGDGGDGG